MLKRLVFILLTTVSSIGYSQSFYGDKFICDTAFISDIEVDCIMNRFAVSLHKDSIYIINNKPKADHGFISINGYSIPSNSFFEVKAYFEDGDEYLSNPGVFPIHSLWFNKDYLYMLIFDRVYKFERKENDRKEVNYNYDSYVELSVDARSIFLLSNNKILLFNSSRDKGNTIYEYDYENNEILNRARLPYPISILSLFSPRDILCVDDEHIYYTPANTYKINIYNYNFELIDSIVYTKKGWNEFPIEKQRFALNTYEYGIDIINHFSDDFREKYSSILRLFAFDNKLIVFYFIREDNTGKYLYDIWSNKNGIWEIVEEGVDDHSKNIRNTRDRLFPFSNFIFDKKDIYRMKYDVPIRREDYRREKQYIKAYEKYVIKHNCLLTIEKLRFVE